MLTLLRILSTHDIQLLYNATIYKGYVLSAQFGLAGGPPCACLVWFSRIAQPFVDRHFALNLVERGGCPGRRLGAVILETGSDAGAMRDEIGEPLAWQSGQASGDKRSQGSASRSYTDYVIMVICHFR